METATGDDAVVSSQDDVSAGSCIEHGSVFHKGTPQNLNELKHYLNVALN